MNRFWRWYDNIKLESLRFVLAFFVVALPIATGILLAHFITNWAPWGFTFVILGVGGAKLLTVSRIRYKESVLRGRVVPLRPRHF